MLKYNQMTDAAILAAIQSEHKWELRKGVLICFGIAPDTFDWEADGNSNPTRVYNWCCHVLNGGEHDAKRGEPKLAAVSIMNGSEQRFEVLRDVLIRFAYSQWPEFTQRTHDIWKKYRAEKGGPSQSALKKKCIEDMRRYAVAKFRKNKQDYLSGKKKSWTTSDLAKEVSKTTGMKENTIRVYCNGVDVSLEWAKKNEMNPAYQDIS